MRTATTPATSTRRSRHLLGAALGALLLFAAAVVWSATPAAAAAPSVTVSPSSGLADGQSVTVTGSGFTANYATMVIVECDATATGAAGCDTNDVQFVKADASGAFTVQLTLRATFTGVDCTKAACIVQAHEGVNPNAGLTATSAPLHFGAAPVTTTTSAAPATTPAQTKSTAGATATTPPATTGGATPGATDPGATSPPQQLPTGADSGRAVLTGPPLLAVVGLLLAIMLLGAGLIGHRHSRSR